MGWLYAAERRTAAAHATHLRDLAQFAKLRPGKGDQTFREYAADEIAVALKIARNTAFIRLHLAVTVTTRLPQTLAALERGELDLRRVQALAEITDPLDPDTARAVEAAILPNAARQNTTELRRAARRAVARLDPNGAQARHTARKQDRRVELFPMDDAMAEVRAYLPAADATRIHRRLDDFARAAPLDDQADHGPNAARTPSPTSS